MGNAKEKIGKEDFIKTITVGAKTEVVTLGMQVELNSAEIEGKRFSNLGVSSCKGTAGC